MFSDPMTAQAKKAKLWADRWLHENFVHWAQSPFGRTEIGLNDYRGVPLRNRALANVEIRDSDFSAADLSHLRIENCTFLNCSFSTADLTGLVTTSSRFEHCKFERSNMRLAQIGYNGTEFYICTFKGAKTTRAGFLNAIFTDVCFDGKDWSHTDFRASGFWNCSFTGALRDVTFRGGYLFPSQRQVAGEPQRTGLHNVSFAGAEFHWVGIHNGCELENITLPTDGHAFMCSADDLISVCNFFDPTSREYNVIADYMEIIRPDPATQSKKIISRNDLIKLSDDGFGVMLYTFLKSKLS
jgi:fluoroquinolone resistance protein